MISAPSGGPRVRGGICEFPSLTRAIHVARVDLYISKRTIRLPQTTSWIAINLTSILSLNLETIPAN